MLGPAAMLLISSTERYRGGGLGRRDFGGS
jgi:hypothetical protein